MTNTKQLLISLVVLSLAALACCGTNCTPLPPTSVTEASQPTLTASAKTVQPPLTQESPLEIPTPDTSMLPENGPLLLHISSGGSVNGDLWALDAPEQPLRQLTNYGYNYNPVLSPDGKYVAYDSTPKGDAPWECSGWPPANIWVLDIASGDAFRAADQPPDSSSDPCGGSNFIQRPQVAWSPGSNFLAWGEHQASETTPHVSYNLVKYDVAQKNQQVIVPDLPGTQGITNGQAVDWGQAGIVDFALPDNLVIVYDANGKELFHTQLDASFTACLVSPENSARWVMDGSTPSIYVQDCSTPSSLTLIDPATGTQSQNDGKLELYSLTAPSGFSLLMTQDSNRDVLWRVIAPASPATDLDVRKASVNSNPSALDMVAISQDGRQIAYLSDSGLMLYDGTGPAVPIDVLLESSQEISWIGWAPTGWRINSP